MNENPLPLPPLPSLGEGEPFVRGAAAPNPPNQIETIGLAKLGVIGAKPLN